MLRAAARRREIFVLNGSEDVRPIRAEIRVTNANDWASSPSNLRVTLYADLTFIKSTRANSRLIVGVRKLISKGCGDVH